MSRFRETVSSSRLLPILVAGALLVTMAWASGRPFGEAGEPSFLIKAGSDFLPEPVVPAGTKIFSGSGFDGQFFFYLAQDPLLTGGEIAMRLDNAAYRQQRILLPALGYLLSGGGDIDALQWVLPAINLIALLAVSWFLAGFLRERGRSPWLALAFAVSFGVLSGAMNDLSDPLAASLFVGGVLCWVRNRTGAAMALFTAACLTRETYVIAVGLVMVFELVRFRRRAVAWLLIPAVVGAWTAYVQLRSQPADAFQQPIHGPDPYPIIGLWSKIEDIVRLDIVGSANWEIGFMLLMTATFGLFAVRSWKSLALARERRAWPPRAELIAPLGLATVVLVPFLSAELWRNPLSYGRYAAAAPALLVMLYAVRRDRIALGLALLTLVASLLNPYYSVAPTLNGPVVTAPGG